MFLETLFQIRSESYVIPSRYFIYQNVSVIHGSLSVALAKDSDQPEFPLEHFIQWTGGLFKEFSALI